MKEVIYKQEENKVPIKSWVTEIDANALEQAKNLSNLPFAFKHVALMPDCHMGFGMPIGGVLATKGVVIPNAVGVDIGCFTGDTKIPLLNGSQKTLLELYKENKKVYVYSLNKDLKLVPGLATPKLTRKNSELMEVVISGGETIRCTPDHKFMLLDGTYKEAKDLDRTDSLMPLYRSYQSRDGYENIRTFSGNGVLTHMMVAEYFLSKNKDSDITHHKDGNWYNNEPSNLEYKDVKLHLSEHRKNNPQFGSEEFKKKRLETLNKNGFYNPKFKESKKLIAIENLKGYNSSDDKKEQDKLAGVRGKKYLVKYNKSEKGRLKSSEVGKKYGFGKVKNNHKVLYTRKINQKEDVYCLTVDKYHNFALSAGVFVHNCGMSAVKTHIKVEDFKIEDLKKIMGEIRKKIPVGFNHNKQACEVDQMPRARRLYAMDELNSNLPVCSREFNNAIYQLGTLGGGNHFIEIQKGSDGYIWVMIHSGSRNLGKQVAEHYNKIAVDLNEKWHSSITKDKELAFLPADSEEGIRYIEEMNYCLEFAFANRKRMMDEIMFIFEDIFHNNLIEDKRINIHHNYVAIENHFGENVYVHRKGATSARIGEKGIIPGSQGTSSYIVEGLGNPESFESCSHGAGRKMGRKEAIRTLDLAAEQKALNDKGILHAIRGKDDLEEASGAYKNIDVVMADQQDLVKILVKLEPLGVIKG